MGQNVIEWGEELEAQYLAWEKEHGHSKAASTGIKRSAGAAAEPAAKKVKVESSGSAISVEEMRERFEENSIDRLKVADLKEWCAGRGLSTTGKKTDLVERVQEYFETK